MPSCRIGAGLALAHVAAFAGGTTLLFLPSNRMSCSVSHLYSDSSYCSMTLDCRAYGGYVINSCNTSADLQIGDSLTVCRSINNEISFACYNRSVFITGIVIMLCACISLCLFCFCVCFRPIRVLLSESQGNGVFMEAFFRATVAPPQLHNNNAMPAHHYGSTPSVPHHIQVISGYVEDITPDNNLVLGVQEQKLDFYETRDSDVKRAHVVIVQNP